MFVVRRHPQNPLISPSTEHAWQARAAFNPSIVRHGTDKKNPNAVRAYYRAEPQTSVIIAPFGNTSSIGMAESEDGVTFHSPQQVLAPREDWEAFGCEDPRAVVIEGKTYITYTALSGHPFGPDNIKAAIAISDDGEHFDERHLLTPFNAKAFALFPEKVNGKFAALLTAHTDWTAEYPRPIIGIAHADRIEDFWDHAYWEAWHKDMAAHALPNLRRSDNDHVEVGAAPILTDHGWLLIYSYIQNYYDESKRIFGVEAVLLDRDDPQRIVGRTYPFLVPEESYERYGMVPNIVFPTCAVISGDTLNIYYGAADTTCALAQVRLDDLMSALVRGGDAEFVRAVENPIIEPISTNEFEARLAFNPAAVDIDGSVHILYRAMGSDNTSMVGYVRSKDGIHIDERLPVPVYGPRADWELKLDPPNGNSGCEDPRAVVIDDMVYMTYTAYDGVHPPQGAITSIPVADFLEKRFENWSEPKRITPNGVDDKDVALLPGRANGSYVLYHRINGRVCADHLDDLSFSSRVSRCIDVLGPRPGMWDSAKVGVAAPPIKIEGGWLMLYHGVSGRSRYRVGAVLLDESGLQVVARTSDPIFEPTAPYECAGEVAHVVFPCGAIVRDDTLFLYYGGGDRVVGVATARLSHIVAALT